MTGKFAIVRKVEFGWWATATTWAIGPQIQRWAGRWSLSLFLLCLELYVTWPCKRKDWAGVPPSERAV